MKAYALMGLAALLAATALPAQQRDRNRDRDRDRDDDEQLSRIDTTLAFTDRGTVDLSLVGGEIVVTGWARREVKIVAESERGVLRLETSPSRIALRVRSQRGHMGDTRYEVSVPAGTRLILASVSGDIAARGVRGEVEATSTNGEILVEDAAGEVLVESVAGELTLRNVQGNIEANAVSGEVVVERATGEIEVHTVSGEIALTGVSSKAVRVETVNGEVDFDGSIDGDGRYEFTTHSGDLRLRLPDGVGAMVSLETFSGEVESDFPLTLEPGERGSRPRRFEFKLGNGGARLDLETFSGDIHLDRGASRTR